jgi:hypothetical protein
MGFSARIAGICLHCRYGTSSLLRGEIIAADETGGPQFYDLLRDTRPPPM